MRLDKQGRIILKWILKDWDGRVNQARDRERSHCCELWTEPFGCTEYDEFF